MVRSIFLLVIYLSFLGLGLAAPFVLTLGYLWVDTFRPQSVSYIILNQIQVALVMGAAAVLGYFLMDRRSPPRLTLPTLLVILMACWVTLTLMWAQVPAEAWSKWNWAFKTLIFSAFVPFVIRSRVQIEAFAQTYVFSLAANFIPFGVKTLISGGGYGHDLGLENGNSNLSEGGFLSTVCLMAIPLALFLMQHSQLLPKMRIVKLGYFGLCGLALVTAIGTFERSALIGMGVLGLCLFWNSKRKWLFIVIGVAVVAFVVYGTSSAWHARIDTIGAPTEDNSALTRLLVWQWTLKFALSHPLGGGFNAFFIDHLVYPDGSEEFARAFHSIYFEVLGEQGWVGIALFLGTAAWTVRKLRQVARQTRNVPELAWCRDFANALFASLMTFLTAGAFVGIAFQPIFWYFVALSVCLAEYVHRVQQPDVAPQGWRASRAASAAQAVRRWQPGGDGSRLATAPPAAGSVGAQRAVPRGVPRRERATW